MRWIVYRYKYMWVSKGLFCLVGMKIMKIKKNFMGNKNTMKLANMKILKNFLTDSKKIRQK